ncbi:phage tail tape measure protein, TP901 family, core region [Pseudomonas taetrolens]|uniref:Phage tail tape measure protein, TP901 family, core region n=1 Tax=Pseudomonas taetrolens TaxID=47884 RepID=A0A0J6GP08_PSETA|nr:phage tail tape measure protein [Pseudomonas taetrolens]KMM83335.1 tail protein [Pseudomonas taetrolens]SEC70270.1 phage tail tape measure protein, TP901 family, core region [Pseudomonas taetrolens]VEH50196.1 tail tape measure protein [Pseudomonas taetrolens]
MANKMALGLVIGGAVSSTVGAAFKDVESRVKKLSEQGKKARVLQSTIGETMRLRDEWRKSHAAGEKGAQALLNRLERNLGVLRKEGIEVGRLAREYDRLGRAGRSAELKAKGFGQIDQGKKQVRAGVAQGVVATGMVAVTAKVSADYQAIIRDIAIKAGVARSAQEGEMSRSIIQTSNDVGMGRNEVADVVNQLVGAGMELKQAMAFAPVAAKFVVGQGSSGVDTAKMIQALQSNANITDPKVLEKALEAVAFQGQAGSFEASDMARWFPQLLASMQKQGITGMDAVTQLGAMLQVQMKTAGTSDEAANNLKNWMEKIGSGEVVDAYKKAGIDYQGSLNTGIQGGMSTLEASFGLAKRYIEATDPKKAAKMAEATAQISKEANPEKAKAMLSSLEQALRTGDIFADMQVKSALTAYVQNKALYEQLKNEAAGASGILDKNLSERRDTSSQKWAETIQAGNDAMRSVGDAIRPVTDALATGLTTVVKGITKLSDESPKLVMGLTALATGASVVTSLLGALKIGRGLVNLARGGLGGRGGAGRAGVQSVFVTNAKDALGGGDDDGEGKGDAVKSLVSAGLSALLGRKDEDKEGEGAPDTKLDPVETGLKLLDVIREAKGGDDETGPDHTQKVFVVNAREIGGGGPGGGGRGGRRSRRRGPPRPPAPPPVPPRLGARLMSAVGTLGKVSKAIPAGTVFEAGIKAFDTFTTAKTAEEKADGYGGAAGGLAGSLAGAAAGAAIGSVVPIIGTAMGGLVGAFLGGMGGDAVGGMFGKTSFAKSLFGTDAEPGDVVRSMQAGSPKAPTPLVIKAESKPAMVEQKFTFAPHMPITVEGDVKDPADLMRQLQPMMQGQLNDFARQMEDSARRANDRKLYDAPHIG